MAGRGATSLARQLSTLEAVDFGGADKIIVRQSMNRMGGVADVAVVVAD